MLTTRLRGAAALAAKVNELYQQGQSDYSLEPVILVDDQGKPVGRIQDGDGVIFCCRRGEREIQLTEAFTDPHFQHFERPAFERLNFVILTRYHEKFTHLPVAFAPSQVEETLGEIISRSGLRQLRVAESEKFAHVTFFFNGGRTQPFEGQTDLCIPSPKGISYELVPELSLPQVAQSVIDGLANGYDLVVANFANGDVIGHTANQQAKLACAEIVDRWLGKVLEAAISRDYTILITADHGNLEELLTPEGKPHVSHTANPVPCVLLCPQTGVVSTLKDGRLADIAPSILAILGLPTPASMTGERLVVQQGWKTPGKVLLLILDGWGVGTDDQNNPIAQAKTPVWDELLSNYPHNQLQAAGMAVGLQANKAGNSEAGHMNIGAGRVVPQDDLRLDMAMSDGSFYTNPVLLNAIDEVKNRGSSLHLIGLLTERSSHGSMEYPLAVARMAKDRSLQQVYLHMIFDGRSTEPGSAPMLLHKLETQLDAIQVGSIVTGIGRGFALDRDGNYAKTQRAFEAMVFGYGNLTRETGG